MFFGATTEYYRSGQPSRSFDRSATRPTPPKGHSTATRDENLPLANPLSASSGQPGALHDKWRTISRVDRHAPSNRSPDKAPTSTYLPRTDSSDVDAKDANDGLRDTVTYQTSIRVTPHAVDSTHRRQPKLTLGPCVHHALQVAEAAQHSESTSEGRKPLGSVVPTSEPKLERSVLARAGANSGSKQPWLHSARRRQAVHTKERRTPHATS
jgi:hypothetical protein